MVTNTTLYPVHTAIAYSMNKSFFIILLLFICSCGDPVQEQIDALQPQIQKQIDNLNSKLNNQTLNNAVLLNTYATKLKATKPEYATLLDNFIKDSQPNGPAIENFKERLAQATKKASTSNKNETLQELFALSTATNHEVYNDSLIDLINTVADLSEGQLPRLNIERKKANDKENGPGSHLVGNTRYGSWQNNGGQSMWVWYGQYRLFSDLIWGRPYYYHSWHYNRPWSYYNDYGRNMYGSKAEINKHANVSSRNSRQVKQYGKQTGRNTSSYSNKKTNSRFKPTKAVSSTSRMTSQYGSSHRSGSRSRGSYGGK